MAFETATLFRSIVGISAASQSQRNNGIEICANIRSLIQPGSKRKNAIRPQNNNRTLSRRDPRISCMPRGQYRSTRDQTSLRLKSRPAASLFRR